MPFQYERPNTLRGVHFGPGTSCGFDIGWWVNELKQMGMGWLVVVDDAGSMYNLARACGEKDITPIMRMYEKWPAPRRMMQKSWQAVEKYIGEEITKWILTSHNETNLPNEWENGVLPQPIEKAAEIVAPLWLADALEVARLGGYPAIPPLAHCAHHGQCSSIRYSRAFFNWLAKNADGEMRWLLDNGAWLAVHDAILNHAWVEDDGWHFEHPRNVGLTPLQDDCSGIGHEAYRDMIWNRWEKRVPIISTEGGVFHIFKRWDTGTYPNGWQYTSYVRNSDDHAVWTLEMFRWYDEYQKTHPWWFGMCPWILAQDKLGHQGIWEHETWHPNRKDPLPVVQMLKDNPPRDLNIPVGPVDPDPIDPLDPDPVDPVDPEPVDPVDPEPPPEGEWPRPPDDNGIGIHFGLGDRLVGAELDQDIARAKDLKATWGILGFGAGEDVMLSAADQLWRNGIMPVVRKVGNISGGYDFGRDTRMLVAAGIPAYVQIFNEPSDHREWESKKQQKKRYPGKWADYCVMSARHIAAAGGYPGFQCLHPWPLEDNKGVVTDELGEIFARLPAHDPLWKRVWFSSHNYGLNHPPGFQEDYWGVLGFLDFAKRFKDFLGFVPPIICGEGGWLWRASEDSRFPRIEEELHAAYHKEMYEWFRLGTLSNGDPLPDYLFAVCPWILSGPEDEAWYGMTIKTKTIEAVKRIPTFVRDESVAPPPPPPPPPTELTIFEACSKYGIDLIDDREVCGKYAKPHKIAKRKPRDPIGFGFHYTASDYMFQTCESIAKDHCKSRLLGGRGKDSILYCFIVDFNAESHIAALVSWCVGQTGNDRVNRETIAISVMGLDATEAQVEEVKRLILALKYWKGRGVPAPMYLVPHCYVNNTPCPGPLKDKLMEGEWPKAS